MLFWRSVNLTGNQTLYATVWRSWSFWRSVNLTGNQTPSGGSLSTISFGAVSI